MHHISFYLAEPIVQCNLERCDGSTTVSRSDTSPEPLPIPPRSRSLFLAMPARKPTDGNQDRRRSTRLHQAIIPEPTLNSPMVSGSPTPTWSGGGSPTRSHNNTVEPQPEEQHEEDEFMPTVREVAETLAGMKSRNENQDRGHEVCLVQLEDTARVHILNVQQMPPVQTPPVQTQPMKGTPGQIPLSCSAINTDSPSQLLVVSPPSLPSRFQGRRK